MKIVVLSRASFLNEASRIFRISYRIGVCGRVYIEIYGNSVIAVVKLPRTGREFFCGGAKSPEERQSRVTRVKMLYDIISGRDNVFSGLTLLYSCISFVTRTRNKCQSMLIKEYMIFVHTYLIVSYLALLIDSFHFTYASANASIINISTCVLSKILTKLVLSM